MSNENKKPYRIYVANKLNGYRSDLPTVVLSKYMLHNNCHVIEYFVLIGTPSNQQVLTGALVIPENQILKFTDDDYFNEGLNQVRIDITNLIDSDTSGLILTLSEIDFVESNINLIGVLFLRGQADLLYKAIREKSDEPEIKAVFQAFRSIKPAKREDIEY